MRRARLSAFLEIGDASRELINLGSSSLISLLSLSLGAGLGPISTSTFTLVARSPNLSVLVLLS